MKYLNIFGSMLCLVYVIFALFTHNVNPNEWPVWVWYVSGACWVALVVLCVIIQNGIEADQREGDKYFEDHTNE